MAFIQSIDGLGAILKAFFLIEWHTLIFPMHFVLIARQIIAVADAVIGENERMPLDQKKRLQDRAEAINGLYKRHRKQGVSDSNQKLIIIHIDSRSKKEQTDVFFYFKPGSNAGERLANKCRNLFEAKYSKTREYDGSSTARDLFMLRETRPVSVYVEMGNIQNPNDQQRFVYEANRQIMANWLYEGIK